MGQANARGTREARIAQVEDKLRDARLRKEMDERALERMKAANLRQTRHVEKGDVVLIPHSSHAQVRMARPNRATLAMLLGIAMSKSFRTYD